jgi:enamine deaminase RidA (YjgF/YER057c/UK114 family)
LPLEAINPKSLARPIGYSHGIKGRGDLLFVAGQVAWDSQERIVSEDLVAQFAQALDNVLRVVEEGGGSAASVARMILYVASKDEYVQRRKELGVVYRERMGRHFPAMALVEVSALLEDGAKVEIEAVALV